MKKNVFFIFLLLIIPFKVHATNDVSINCNKNDLKINEETTCKINVSNLDFTIIDITGKIKVGDLFNFWGHISILIGEDKDNYYIAESLNNYKGVVVKKYSKKKVRDTFTYVVLMDDVYKSDGNLTDMWY